MTNPLASSLVRAAREHGDRPALRLDDYVLDYRALDEASARLADYLRRAGVEPGDRVGIMLPNVPPFAIIYYGTLRAGGVVVPMNPLLKAREVAYYLGDSEATILFAWHQFADDAEQGAKMADVNVVIVEPDSFADLFVGTIPDPRVDERAPDDTAVLLYTSGTTGKPKGAELTQDNLARNADVTVRTLLHLGPEDVVLGALPLFHSFGQTCGLNSAIAVAACLTLLPRFDPGKALGIIARDRVTVFEGVPTMYAAMLNFPQRDAYDVSSLRVCISGGAALPVEVMRAFEQAFDATILEGYGLSETSPVASFNHPDCERRAGSIGTPIEGVEMRLVALDGSDVPRGEVGEIAIRGHNVMKGYWAQPEGTAAAIPDGWFRSGDLARQDEEGYYYIVDRKKDMIIRGGYNVYPREIEEILYEHPDVTEAAVVGIEHPALGEEVGAAVALRPGSMTTVDELREHVKNQVANYKYPRHVWLVEALPKGPTGKIQKREIVPPAEVTS
ncbi:MAG: long-chain fatty acid--CoA ligase [Actinomycetota bacterium]|nr:long-chain fatty acid--CoA ligase [Actinomycetota bacterium]